MSNLGKCTRCSKTVYSQEGFIAVKVPFHRSCFKCEVCNWQLVLTNYKSINGKVYCANHYPVGGLSVTPEKTHTTADDLVTKNALNAPKVDTVNEQLRGGNEKPQTSTEDLVTKNALKAPKLDNVNNQVRGVSDSAPLTSSDDLVTKNALKAPKLDNVNNQVRGTSAMGPQTGIDDLATANALKAPKLDTMTGYQKSVQN
ncbi:hypothetical protein RB653_008119 [Dictyostelium firmibasis]|uniref:LIM zinc-binding domain-containing protein n=1 Tax=Dictyostelium firmibasis TaxID=79012 RepID=A0AAN7UC38_9MYCE